MPRYDYRCSACREVVEVRHGVHEEGPTMCPSCGRGSLRKTFAPPTIVFKGSGWAKKERTAGTAPSAKPDGPADAPVGEAGKTKPPAAPAPPGPPKDD